MRSHASVLVRRPELIRAPHCSRDQVAMQLSLLLLLLLCATSAYSYDPAMSWLCYAEYTCPAGSIITKFSMQTIVPSFATKGGGTPALWPGIENAATPSFPENSLLIQPILKLGEIANNKWSIFNEFYNWV